MASYFTLELDTRAPEVVWGAAGGLSAGALFQIAYTLDEPAITAAEIELGDGRVIPLGIQPGWLEVLLPPDAPQGNATVRAFVRDDVDNTATRTTVVALTGVVVEPDEPPPHFGGAPDGPRRIERAAIRDHATAVGRTRSRVRVTTHVGDTATTRIRTSIRRRRVPAPPPIERPPVIFRDRSTAVGRGRSRLTVRITGHSAGEMTSKTTIRRGDSPEVEALILDL